MSVTSLDSYRYKQDEDELWCCDCGSYGFHLYADSSVQCIECGEVSDSQSCWWHEPEEPPVKDHPKIYKLQKIVQDQ